MKYLFFILTSFILLWNSFLGVSTASDDITSPDYKIDLSTIDPMTHSSTSSVGMNGTDGVIALLGIIANILLFSIPLIAGVSFIIAGYYYVLSSGDSEKVSQAKTIIKWNLIAISIAMLSYLIITMITNMLSGTLL